MKTQGRLQSRFVRAFTPSPELQARLLVSINVDTAKALWHVRRMEATLLEFLGFNPS